MKIISISGKLDQQYIFWRLVRIYLPQGLHLKTPIALPNQRIVAISVTNMRLVTIKAYL